MEGSVGALVPQLNEFNRRIVSPHPNFPQKISAVRRGKIDEEEGTNQHECLTNPAQEVRVCLLLCGSPEARPLPRLEHGHAQPCLSRPWAKMLRFGGRIGASHEEGEEGSTAELPISGVQAAAIPSTARPSPHWALQATSCPDGLHSPEIGSWDPWREERGPRTPLKSRSSMCRGSSA